MKIKYCAHWKSKDGQLRTTLGELNSDDIRLAIQTKEGEKSLDHTPFNLDSFDLEEIEP